LKSFKLPNAIDSSANKTRFIQGKGDSFKAVATHLLSVFLVIEPLRTSKKDGPAALANQAQLHLAI
jgi:hypothetical protein